MAKNLLGLGCGELDGSAEILLKVALRAAEDAGAAIELVRLNELRIPSGPDAPEPDDAWWFWERLVECDAFVVSTPIISRTVAARLKLLADRLLGPNADAAIIEELVAAKRAGGEPAVPFRVDERVLKPRVAGFIAVGGSLTPQWKTLALPILHTTTFSMHMAVVDQVQFEGAGTPRSIVLDEAALARAAQLGRNVAEQIGRPFDEADYRGEPGLCPLCHLDVVVLRGRDVECATCGARGRLVVGSDGATVAWTDLTTSVISMDEKRAHFFEIRDTAERHARQRAEIEARAAEYATLAPAISPGTNAAGRYGQPMAENPRLLIQLARDGAVDRQLQSDPPPSVADGDVVVERLAADAGGRLEPPEVGQVVLSVPSPETLGREPEEVRRVIDGAGAGAEPVIVIVEAAEELREEELSTVLDAADRTRRAVILRIAADA